MFCLLLKLIVTSDKYYFRYERSDGIQSGSFFKTYYQNTNSDKIDGERFYNNLSFDNLTRNNLTSFGTSPQIDVPLNIFSVNNLKLEFPFNDHYNIHFNITDHSKYHFPNENRQNVRQNFSSQDNFVQCPENCSHYSILSNNSSFLRNASSLDSHRYGNNSLSFKRASEISNINYDATKSFIYFFSNVYQQVEINFRNFFNCLDHVRFNFKILLHRLYFEKYFKQDNYHQNVPVSKFWLVSTKQEKLCLLECIKEIENHVIRKRDEILKLFENVNAEFVTFENKVLNSEHSITFLRIKYRNKKLHYLSRIVKKRKELLDAICFITKSLNKVKKKLKSYFYSFE